MSVIVSFDGGTSISQSVFSPVFVQVTSVGGDVLLFACLPSAPRFDAAGVSAAGIWLLPRNDVTCRCFMVYQQVLDFLSVYYPRYLCPPCLAALLDVPEHEMRGLLTHAIRRLDFATAYCLNCHIHADGVRFKMGALDSRAG